METWAQPPRLQTGADADGNRHASWLELFFDLVFVVAIAQLAHEFSGHLTWMGALGFVALFIPIWWAWIGSTFYATRFDTDDVEYRLLTAVEMFGVIALAVNVHGGLGATSRGFALAYVLVRSVLVFKYYRAYRHLPEVRSLTRPMATGYAVAALLWLVSVFVPAPSRFALWGVAIAIDFATPILVGDQHVEIPVHPSHIPERFGLFTIIVLGETIISVVSGISIQHWTLPSVLIAVCSTGIAFSLWWLYFDNYDESAVRSAREEGRIWNYFEWIFVHFPLVVGITAVGVGVLSVFTGDLSEPLAPATRWLLVGSLALCLISLSLLQRTTISCAGKRPKSGIQSVYRFGSVSLVLFIGIASGRIPPIAFIALLTVACLVQIGTGYKIRNPGVVAETSD